MGRVRPEHEEQIERSARYVREHPKEWKKHLNRFIDAQILMARRAYNKLSQTEEGREKIRVLKQLKIEHKI